MYASIRVCEWRLTKKLEYARAFARVLVGKFYRVLLEDELVLASIMIILVLVLEYSRIVRREWHCR